MKKIDLLFAFILLPVDIAMIVLSFVLAYYVRIDLEVVPAFSDIGIQEYLKYSLYLIPIWVLLLGLNGLYTIRAQQRGRIDEFYRIFSASSSAMLFLIVWIFMSRSFFFSRLILIFTWVISILALFLGRIIIQSIQRSLFHFGVGRKNILLVGDNTTSETVSAYLSKNPGLGYRVKGVLSCELLPSRFGLKIVGIVDQLQEKINSLKIDEIILTDINLSKTKIIDIIQTCSDYKVVFKYIPDTLSLMNLNVSPELIGTMPVMELKPIPLEGWGRIAKRMVDFIFAFLWLVVLFPLFLLIAFLEKAVSPGPVFFSHPRIGRDGKTFSCHKFRSMYVDKCDFKGGTKWTTKADEINRVTPVGKILRKTNLDELPQLWNILKGEMSFVGPRPEQPKLVKKFESEIPEYFKRHRVKAGLTGWAQVNGLKGDTSIKERVRYDIYYIEHWSLWLDIKIIFKTIILTINEALFGKSEYRPRP